MKFKRLFTLSFKAILTFSFFSLAACQSQVVTNSIKYHVKYKTNDQVYMITGINEDGYENGDTVTFKVLIVSDDYELVSVNKDGVPLLVNSQGNYSFKIEGKDIVITIIVKSLNIDVDEVDENIFTNPNPGENKNYPDHLDDFEPTQFDEKSFKTIGEESLGDGVNHVTYSFNLNNGNSINAHVIEVDLTKAQLNSNYAEDGIATPYDQMLDFEEKNNKKVMAVVNGDFFATGSGISVNAYATNNFVIKASHNDNGVYDYLDPQSDVPASNPMLIGVSGDTAKISSIIDSDVKKDVIQAKLSNILVYLNDNGEQVELKENVISNFSELSDKNNQLLVTKNGIVKIKKDQQIIKIKYDKNGGVLTSGEVVQMTTQKIDGSKNISDADEYFYVISNNKLDIKNGQKFGFGVTSPDDTFKYYSTIIGGRQSLVENGNIAPTVKLENTNGAQTTGIPRTSIGVIDEHNIVLCSIEGLRYNVNNNVSANDTFGVNLPELAEFMRYIGCYDAMNFDGGGSTQLITKNDNGNGEANVQVRSSDYGTFELEDSRKVYNTVIISTK